MIKIGIDPGHKTGIAITSKGKLIHCKTMKIHEAIKWMEQLALLPEVRVIVEDARKRSGKPEAAQGAGSVKRDCSIWFDYLKDLKISFKMIPPIRNGTRFRDQIFKAKYPYWKKRTSQHSRAAANLLLV